MWRAPAIRPAAHSWSSRTSISWAPWAASCSACSGVTSRSMAGRLRPRPARLRAAAELVGHDLVRPARPGAQHGTGVARVDDVLDAEALGRPEGGADGVQPSFDLGAQRDRVLRRLEVAPVGGLEAAGDRQRAP